MDGVRKLMRAIEMLGSHKRLCEIVYVGPAKHLTRFSIPACAAVTATGFIESSETRDKILSECAVGFLPGPTGAPESDSRSKYSIPSRILDFMAIGLPIVGAVHPRSATASFCREFGVNTGLVLANEQVASTLAELASRELWEVESGHSLSAFGRLSDSYSLTSLFAVLGELARSS